MRIDVDNLDVYYGDFLAVQGATFLHLDGFARRDKAPIKGDPCASMSTI